MVTQSIYSKSYNIRHPRGQKIVGYCNFPDSRTLYLMHILPYLETLSLDILSCFLLPHFLFHFHHYLRNMTYIHDIKTQDFSRVINIFILKNAVFWGVAPCRCGRLNRRLQLPAHAGSSLEDFSTLKMEAIRSSETSVIYTAPHPRRRHSS
jgi:hypothetical protein